MKWFSREARQQRREARWKSALAMLCIDDLRSLQSLVSAEMKRRDEMIRRVLAMMGVR